MDTSADTDHDISGLSFANSMQHSTPNATPKKGRPLTSRKHFQAPAPKQPSGPLIGTCQHCGKQYRSPIYFKRHKIDHKLREVASNFPSIEKLEAARSDIVSSVLEKMAEGRPIGSIGRDSQTLVSCITETKYSSKLCTVKFCLPSSLLLAVQDFRKHCGADLDFRKLTLESLNPDNSLSNSAIHSFILEFLCVLGEKLIHFISQSLMADQQPSVPPAGVFISIEERQAIHYVSGSIIREYQRKAGRFKNNKFWLNIESAIKGCILEGDRVVAAVHSDRYWTEFANRGALNFIGANFLDFIVEVVYLLHTVERPDGSLLDEDVQRELLLSPARNLWDKMVGNKLDETDTILFLRGIVRSFTATYGRGSCLKRMNEEMQSPEITLSLRKRLAKYNDQKLEFLKNLYVPYFYLEFIRHY